MAEIFHTTCYTTTTIMQFFFASSLLLTRLQVHRNNNLWMSLYTSLIIFLLNLSITYVMFSWFRTHIKLICDSNAKATEYLYTQKSNLDYLFQLLFYCPESRRTLTYHLYVGTLFYLYLLGVQIIVPLTKITRKSVYCLSFSTY